MDRWSALRLGLSGIVGCNHAAFMYLGRLIEYGPTAEVFMNPHLRETEEYIAGRFG